VEPRSPAERGGIAVGDVLLKVDGREVTGGDDFVRTMRAHHGRDLVVELTRAGNTMTVVVNPERVDRDGQIFGRIGAGIDDRPALVQVSYGVGEALVKAVGHTWEMSVFSLKMLGRMLIGEVSWRNLSGPVTIADYAGKTARLGATYYLNFIALVSISLGVLNLLPIPVLDGGYLLYYSIEAVRSKPVPAAWMELGTKFGLAIVVIAMSLALFNDISRLVAG
jgi:regulator of sigma E protease